MSINSQKSIYALYRSKNDALSQDKKSKMGAKSRRYED